MVLKVRFAWKVLASVVIEICIVTDNIAFAEGYGGTNVWAILNHILDVVFCNYVKVLRNEIPADESSADMIYSFVYRSIEPYFVSTEEVSPRVTMDL